MKTHKIQSENLNISVINNGTLTKHQQQPFVMVCTPKELKQLCLDFSERLNTYIDIASRTSYIHLVQMFDDDQQFLGEYVEKINKGYQITNHDRNLIRLTIKEALKVGSTFLA